LLLAHVLPDGTTAPGMDRARERLERIARDARLQGVVASTVLLVGDPVEQIVSYTAGNGIGTVALVSHGDWGNDGGLQSSVADAIVVRQAPVPVLVWRAPLGDTQAASSRLQRLVVPLDGSRLAEGALPDALDLVRATGGRVLLVHVVNAWQPVVGRTNSDLVQCELRAAGEYLASVRDRFRHLRVWIRRQSRDEPY
jgi:nucleotide-binding universal stress UspA family protein